MLSGGDCWDFGTDDSCHLRIKKPGVNAFHCCLRLKKEANDEDYNFQLDNKAVTYINGSATPIKTDKRRKMYHGDILTIGGRQIRIGNCLSTL